MNNTAPQIIDNIKQQRFEMALENNVALINYRWQNGKLALLHTEVPEEAEGKGIAKELVKFAFDFAKQQQKKVLIYCSYISSYIKHHPEYNDLVEKDYNA